MNIFVVEKDELGNPDFIASAYSMDRKRLIKMILESAQMLCTVLNEKGFTTPYKSTHRNHPCTLWTSESVVNFWNLLIHANALSRRYTELYNKRHKCQDVLDLIYQLPVTEDLFSFSVETSIKLAMPDEYKSSDLVESYRKYYANKDNLDYRGLEVPTWIYKYRINPIPILM